jgi:four helix bundle protein
MKDEQDKKLIDLKTRTKAFALRVIRLYSALPQTPVAQVIGKQLLRSGTSVGAHYREGARSRSDAEFISKLEGALQELEETAYWLELLGESGTLPRPTRGSAQGGGRIGCDLGDVRQEREKQAKAEG